MQQPSDLDGFIADFARRPLGLITVHVEDGGCEVVTLNSIDQGVGVGTALLAAAEAYARGHRCNRLWLITTNDNTQALRFYQRRGMRIHGWYSNAIAEARKLKPEIPLVGRDGIPLRDEIELVKEL
jgi:GNAT superfamily N-acetyltransferase